MYKVLRTNSDAIITTAKTVINDNDTMNIRVVEAEQKKFKPYNN